MKRIHLFEFEDFSWFPSFLRNCMTRYIQVIHRLFKTSEHLENLLRNKFLNNGKIDLLDFCSGAGGPLIDVYTKLKKDNNVAVTLTLTDLFPNLQLASEINNNRDANTRYLTSPVDVTTDNSGLKGLRTMICSFHHMPPQTARRILEIAFQLRKPICIYELSDNSLPILANLVSFPIGVMMTLMLTPLVRPFSWTQLVFTYLIPILPVVIAWDGAVSNMRTYTSSDIDELLAGLESQDYRWEKGVIDNAGRSMYLIGNPVI